MGEPLVKICGLTRLPDVEAAVQSGADAVGFVFTASPRQLDAHQARELAAGVQGRAACVGVFLDPSAEWVTSVLRDVPLDWLQFHGQESEAFCTQFGLPWLKALTAGLFEQALAEPGKRAWPGASGVLVDSHAPGGQGGSGKTLDWNRLGTASTREWPQRLWLAGGLQPDNVAAAVRCVQPAGVDVSSGVESAPGIKDADRVAAFIHEAKNAL